MDSLLTAPGMESRLEKRKLTAPFADITNEKHRATDVAAVNYKADSLALCSRSLQSSHTIIAAGSPGACFVSKEKIHLKVRLPGLR